jgi:hypothetical protein
MTIEKLLELSRAFFAGFSVAVSAAFAAFLGQTIAKYLARKESKK